MDKTTAFTRLAAAAMLTAGAAAFTTGCTTTGLYDNANQKVQQESLQAQVNEALSRLYRAAPGSEALVARSAGALVFPQVVGGSLIVGVEHGRGLLYVAGNAQPQEYTINAGSLGLQAGGQAKSVIYVFNSPEALEMFRRSNGWTIGIDATAAIGHLGANGMVDSRTSEQPVTSFVLTNVGLEAGVSVQGAKVSRTR